MAEKDEEFSRIGRFISMNRAHIANHYLHACLPGAVRQGHRADELLRSATIPVEWLDRPGQLITEQQLTRLIKAVWRATGDELMGLAAHPCRNGVFALMAEFCLSAETLGAMLRRSARFYSAVYGGIDIGLEECSQRGDGLLFFRIHLKDTRNDPDHLLQEFLLLMWQRLGCWLVDQQIPIAATQFSYASPKHVKEYQAMYPGKHLFEQTVSGFYLAPRYLQLPIVKSEAALAVFLKESPAYILHRPSQDDRLQTKIRLILSQYDYTAMPSLEGLGRELHLAPRTIGRKLKDEGTTFSKIVEAVRREYAVKLLTTENLSIADVSERLGFAETASFCRAFKRWTGRAPSAWGRNSRVAH